MKIIEKLKQALYPEHYTCALCDKEINYTGSDFCDECLPKLPIINSKVCLRCGEPINIHSNYCLTCKNTHHHFKKNISCFTYEPPISNLIIKYKFNNAKYLGNIFSSFMLQKCIEANIIPDIIIPVPLHSARIKERGFNQAELLCKDFANKINKPILSNCLVRIKNTPKQSTLSPSDRLNDVKDAFKVVDNSQIKNKIILLVDDVYTTGATLSACAQALLKAKAKEVYCLTIAHAIKNKI